MHEQFGSSNSGKTFSFFFFLFLSLHFQGTYRALSTEKFMNFLLYASASHICFPTRISNNHKYFRGRKKVCFLKEKRLRK